MLGNTPKAAADAGKTPRSSWLIFYSQNSTAELLGARHRMPQQMRMSLGACDWAGSSGKTSSSFNTVVRVVVLKENLGEIVWENKLGGRNVCLWGGSAGITVQVLFLCLA